MTERACCEWAKGCTMKKPHDRQLLRLADCKQFLFNVAQCIQCSLHPAETFCVDCIWPNQSDWFLTDASVLLSNPREIVSMSLHRPQPCFVRRQLFVMKRAWVPTARRTTELLMPGKWGTFSTKSWARTSVSTDSLSSSGGDTSFIWSMLGTNVFIANPSARQGSRPAVVKFALHRKACPAALSSHRLFSSKLISFSGQSASRRTERSMTFWVSSVGARNVKVWPASQVKFGGLGMGACIVLLALLWGGFFLGGSFAVWQHGTGVSLDVCCFFAALQSCGKSDMDNSPWWVLVECESFHGRVTLFSSDGACAATLNQNDSIWTTEVHAQSNKAKSSSNRERHLGSTDKIDIKHCHWIWSFFHPGSRNLGAKCVDFSCQWTRREPRKQFWMIRVRTIKARHHHRQCDPF